MTRKWLKPLSIFMLTIFLNQLVFPTVSYALTGGPTQPEVHGFEPVNSNQMVDLFTGDFTYSVPLMDVGGYPINLAYHAGAKMDQEASMVGLGWSLTPGAINRSIRGIPDDFKGDEIQTQQNIRPNETWGVGVTFPVEAIGIDVFEKFFNASYGAETYYNSYKGFGTRLKAGVGFDFENFNFDIKSGVSEKINLSGKLSLNITSDSKQGIGLNPNISASVAKEKELYSAGASKTESFEKYENLTSGITASLGMNFSSSRGVTGLSYGVGTFENSSTVKYITLKELGMGGTVAGGSSEGANLGGQTSIGYSAYLPSQPQNMLNYNMGRKFSGDASVFGIDFQGQFNGYYSTQWMRPEDQNASAAAYGALYNSRVATKVQEEDKSKDKLLDFNRTTDYAYQHGSTNLQLSQTTHDMYSIAGQGTGGVFRLHGNDIPVYGDPINYNRSSAPANANVGFEAGPSTKFGANIGLSSHYSHSGSWLESWGNDFVLQNAEQIDGQDAFFQQRYFMKSGEMTPVDQNVLDHDQGIAPSQPVIDFTNNLKEYKLRSKFRSHGTEKSINTADRASGRLYERRARNSSIDYLTNAEAKTYGLNRSIFSYGELLTGTQYQTDEAEVYSRAELIDVTETAVRKGHHIGAFKVTEPNGTKYIYDLPAYNFTAYEVAFNVNAKGSNQSYEYYKKINETGLIAYDDQTDASVANENGESHFFQKRSVPAHAHAHLLTGILSPDYVDVRNDGITEDDLGTAVKFNYSLHTDEYGWRSPYEEGMARFNEAFRSVDDDDKASYSYGTKELWYVHSIESKTHIAEFYYSDREDALGVSDERGTKGSSSDQKMQKLDRIELYNKADRFTNKEAATPIKVVHFTYSYELCKGVPNHINSASNGGKLTLKQLSFSYGKSQKAMMSPYVFKYDGLNPDYDPLSYDSWSGYKPNDPNFPNNYFPYAEQYKPTADSYASAWNLTQINLPSGGQMNIEYESDDYAHVMEHDAHRMFKLKGISDNEDFNSINNGPGDILYDEDGSHLYLFFDLESSGGDDDSIKERYMPRNGILYYKFSTFIKERNEPEFIMGFAEVEDMGIDDNNSTVGWMKIKPHELDNGEKVNPISFDAWNFFLQNLNEKVFDHEEIPGAESGRDFISNGIDNVLSHMDNVLGFARGKYRQMARKKYASQVALDHSVMRLKDPNGRKIGGGHRVKQLSMTDNWTDVTTADYQNGVYGTVYAYTEDGDPDTYSESTGVASYETAYGTDENPYRLPISFDVHKFPKTNGIPDFVKGQLKEDHKWLSKFLTNEAEIMGPIGEAFFPNPSVGYSKVTVKSLATQNGDGTPTGKSVHQFYTTRSHPIRIEQTPIDHHYRQTNPLLAFLSGTSWTRTAASQGYSVITNDMNGRPFATESFDHKGDLISGAKYVYQTRGSKTEVKNGTAVAVNLADDLSLASIEEYKKLQLDYASSENNWLDNEVRVLDRYGNLKNRTLGIEYDISLDTRASRSVSWQGSFDPNLDVPVIAGVPVPLPMLMFGTRYDKSKFNSATATKIIQQHAILKSVIAFDEQSVVRTENVLWDEETGNVLLTKTYNEYNDAISNFSYPAHYAYKNLGSPVKNQGLEIKKDKKDKINFKDGLGTVASAADYFTQGDLLATEWIQYEIRNKPTFTPHGITYSEDTVEEFYQMKAWVKEVKGDQLFLIDREGSPLSGNLLSLKVLESGYKNILGGSVAAFTSMEEVDLSQSQFQRPDHVTQASAATFSDHWQTYADEVIVEKCQLDTSIAYVLRDALNDAASGTFFDSLSNGHNALYHMSRTSSFAGSEMTDLLHEHTGYPTVVSGTCTDSAYTDTLFIYDVRLENGQPSSVRFTGNKPPESTFDQYESWSLTNTTLIPRVFKQNCQYDTSYADYIGYDASRSVPGSFHFTLGKLGTSLDKNYCEFVLHDTTTGSSLNLGDINGLSNIRLNEFVDDGRHFFIDATTPSGTVVLQGSTNCFSLADCWKECQRTDEDIVNPYVIGIRGIWRGKDNYAYHADRNVTVATNEYIDRTMTRHDGAFAYQPLWTFNSQNGGLDFDNSAGKWISPATLTKVSPAGNHIESVDALGRPSAEIYGYQRRLVTGVAQNAGHHEIGFDGFEDYDYPYYLGCRKEAHWSMQENNIDFAAKATTLSESPEIKAVSLDSLSTYLSQEEVHTGRASLRVAKNNFATATNVLFDSDTTTYDRGKMEAFKVGQGDLIQNFALEKGKKYVISGWVKEDTASRALSKYSNVYLRVKVNGISQSEDFYPDGPIIEGWQRVFAEFTIPDEALASSISIEAVVGNVAGAGAYFDDIRIQPYNSAMVSYVYDPMTLRLTAELDENNFATFYEYDQEGRLLRIKKETERGIVTLQESRYGIPKQ